MTEQSIPAEVTNRYDRMEIAGAFGDLGTLVPFVVAYIGVLKMDPYGVLLAFGLSMLACGLVYRTPIPVQPMKAAGAIATTQAAQSLIITPAMVWSASLATGVVWLVLGLTGTAHHVARLITRPVVLGIILGLGFGFMIEGAKMMAQNWWIGGVALLGTSLLLTNRVIPAMFLLLLFGASYGILSDPTLLAALRDVRIEPRWPEFALTQLTFNDVLVGTVFLALPQVPLTLGNAVIAITEENNRLFPAPILGVILFLIGAQLALGACDVPKDKGERFVLMVTGALAVWNVGIAFLFGVTAYWLNKKGLLRKFGEPRGIAPVQCDRAVVRVRGPTPVRLL